MTSLPSAHPALKETLRLYYDRHRDLKLLDVAEGAAVGDRWLSQFTSGKIADPSFNRVMRLRDFLLQDKAQRELSQQAN